MERKKSEPLKKNKTSVLKKQSRKPSGRSLRKTTVKAGSSIKETGNQQDLVAYSEGFNVGFAKGFEDSHAMTYQGKVK